MRRGFLPQASIGRLRRAPTSIAWAMPWPNLPAEGAKLAMPKIETTCSVRFEFRGPMPESTLIASGAVDSKDMALALGASLLTGHPDHHFQYEGDWDSATGRARWLFLVRQTLADFTAVPGAPPARRQPF
jgi:hypothetical protein